MAFSRSRSLLQGLALLIVLAALPACDTTEPPTVTLGVLVAAQGQFGADDGGLTAYDPATGTASEAYSGLYVQSVAVHEGRVYLASTDRIEVLDPDGLGLVQTIPAPNPRYLSFNGTRAYVTLLYTDASTFGDGGVAELNLNTGTASAPTILGGNPDGIVRLRGQLFVANYDFGAGTTLTVLDAATLAETDRIELGCDGPRFVFADIQGEIIVTCTGNAFASPATNGAFVVVDPNTGTVTDRADLDTTLGTASVGTGATYSPAERKVYALADAERAVYRFDTTTNSLEATLNVGGAPLNAVAFDDVDGRLYIGRLNAANPFTARGNVTVHDRAGTEVGRFTAQPVPTDIAFLRGETEEGAP